MEWLARGWLAKGPAHKPPSLTPKSRLTVTRVAGGAGSAKAKLTRSITGDSAERDARGLPYQHKRFEARIARRLTAWTRLACRKRCLRPLQWRPWETRRRSWLYGAEGTRLPSGAPAITNRTLQGDRRLRSIRVRATARRSLTTSRPKYVGSTSACGARAGDQTWSGPSAEVFRRRRQSPSLVRARRR